MSFKTYNAKNNKAKKGISPVIATVILVAVAVVIAAALAGFSSSLFGTYSSAGAAVTVVSADISAAGDDQIILENSGNVADEVVSVQVAPNPSVLAGDFAGESDIVAEAGGQATIITNAAELGTFTEGQVVTVKITMQSGAILTQSVIVTA